VTEPSRRFDRAASFYDRTRALPDGAMAELVGRLVGELARRGPALEIGVGTGRIGLPLHAAGIAMAGVDLSVPMMEVLIEKGGGRPPFPLARADATSLPFPADRFGAAVASHVFHLIPSWRDAIDELVRVVRSGGVVLSSGRERDDGSVATLVQRHFVAETGLARTSIGARHDGTDVAEAFARHGAQERVLRPVHISRTITVGAVLHELESNQWSWTWSLPDDVVHRAAALTRSWAETEIGPLDAEHLVETQVSWRAYELPA